MSPRPGERGGKRNPIIDEQTAHATLPFQELNRMFEPASEEVQVDEDAEEAYEQSAIDSMMEEDPHEIPADEMDDPEERYFVEPEEIETPLSRDFKHIVPWLTPSLEIIRLPGGRYDYVIFERRLLNSNKFTSRSENNELRVLRRSLMERVLVLERLADFLLTHFTGWLDRLEDQDRDLFLPVVSISDLIREKWDEVGSGQRKVSDVNTFVGNVLGRVWLKLPNGEIILGAALFSEDKLPVHRRSVIIAMSEALRNMKSANDTELFQETIKILGEKRGESVEKFSKTTFTKIKKEFQDGNYGLS